MFDLTPLRDEYPWQGQFLPVNGLKLHYLDVGRGDPVVMLHGNPTWSYMWRNVIRALEPNHRLIVPDHMGMGLSDRPDDERYEYTLERRVDDLDALLEHLGLRSNITLMVHDWGGMIGLAWMRRRPGRVRRLVAMNTAGFGLPEGKRLPWQIGLVRYLPMGFLVRGLNAFAAGATRACVVRSLPPQVKDGFLAPYDSYANRIAVHRFVQDIPLQPGDRAWDIVADVSAHLEQLQSIPILLCWGLKDFVFDERFLSEWQRRLPMAEVLALPDAGHYLLEDAHDRIVSKIQDFFVRYPLSPGGQA